MFPVMNRTWQSGGISEEKGGTRSVASSKHLIDWFGHGGDFVQKQLARKFIKAVRGQVIEGLQYFSGEFGLVFFGLTFPYIGTLTPLLCVDQIGMENQTGHHAHMGVTKACVRCGVKSGDRLDQESHHLKLIADSRGEEKGRAQADFRNS